MSNVVAILSKWPTTVFRNNLVMLFWKHIWDWCNIFEQTSVFFKRGRSLHFSWFQDREICYLTTDDNRILFRESWSTVHSPWCTWMKACKSIWTIFQTGGSSIRWTTFVVLQSEWEQRLTSDATSFKIGEKGSLNLCISRLFGAATWCSSNNHSCAGHYIIPCSWGSQCKEHVGGQWLGTMNSVKQ